MKLSELIAAVGDGNVFVQNLADNVTNVSKKKQDTEVKFVTSHNHGQAVMNSILGQPTMLAFVLWIPMDKVPAEVLKILGVNTGPAVDTVSPIGDCPA